MQRLLLILVSVFAIAAAPKRATPTPATPDPSATGNSKLVHPGPNGKLVYEPYTDQGDTIPDFSNCGYMGGGVRIPNVATKITLRPETGGVDDTPRIQQAIDEIAAMPLGADGFRGALVLSRGYYRIGGSLKIHANGIILRGEGSGEGGTVLTAIGNKPRAMITVASEAKQVILESKESPDVTDEYVPVGARSLHIADASHLRVGDTII